MNRTALTLPLMLVSGVAAADVTPQDVWSNLQASYAAIGLDLTGSTATNGNTMLVTDGLVRVTFPMETGQASITMPDLSLTNQGDGTVRISTADAYILNVTATLPESDQDITLDVAIAQTGFDSVASGNPGDVTYTTDVANFDMIVNNLSGIGDAGSLSMELDTDGYASVTQVTEGTVLTIVSDIENRRSTTRFSIDAGGMVQESASTAEPGRSQVTFVLPPDMNIMNLSPALRAGLSLTAAIQTGGSDSTTSTSIDGSSPSEQVQKTGPGTAEFAVDQNGLRLTADGETLEASMNQPDLIPFPIDIAVDSYSARFAMPLLASDAPQGFVYAFDLAGLALNETIWGLVDPAGVLERTPLDLGIDLGGLVDWRVDLPDVAAVARIGESGALPVQILSFDINRIALQALAGMVTGNGSFTFDNSDMITFDGFPRPEGSATLQASGLNGVIDQLVSAGLLPEEQAGMGRMMMGMFGRATGDDSLETTVEINGEGHVILNGQRMR